MNHPYLWQMLLAAGFVTILLRAVPFLLFGTGRKVPDVVTYIGKVLSPASIAMLCVYCFCCYARDRAPATHLYGLAEILAAILVVGLQLWKRNPLLSILAGSALYMVLVQHFIP